MGDIIMVPLSDTINGEVHFYELTSNSNIRYKYLGKIISNTGFILGLNSCIVNNNSYVLISNFEGAQVNAMEI